MPTLFIANATTRNHHFHYRIPEVMKLFDREIPAGQQWQIPEDHRSAEDITAIVSQLQRYGAVHRSSVKSADKNFSGIIFDEKPISVEAIRQGFEDVDQAAIDKALEERQRGAIAADEQVTKLAQEAGTGVGSLEVTIQEQGKRGDNPKELQNSVIQVKRDGRPVSERSRQQATKAARG